MFVLVADGIFLQSKRLGFVVLGKIGQFSSSLSEIWAHGEEKVHGCALSMERCR